MSFFGLEPSSGLPSHSEFKLCKWPRNVCITQLSFLPCVHCAPAFFLFVEHARLTATSGSLLAGTLPRNSPLPVSWLAPYPLQFVLKCHLRNPTFPACLHWLLCWEVHLPAMPALPPPLPALFTLFRVDHHLIVSLCIYLPIFFSLH